MNESEKLSFVSSEELVEYMRLCGSENRNVESDLLNELNPTSIPTLISALQSILA